MLLLLTIFVITHIKYIKPTLSWSLTAHDCWGPRAVAYFALPKI